MYGGAMTQKKSKHANRRTRKVRIPIGIEKVLCAAAADREFCEQLVMARRDALNGTGLELSASETMILEAVPEAQLRTMVENIDLKRHKRRRFFRGIAAASLAATTAMGVSDCNELVTTTGIDPHEDVTQGDVLPPEDTRIDVFTPPKETLVGSDTVEVIPDVQDVEIEDVNVSAGIPPMDVVPPPDTTVVGSDTVEIDDVNVSAGIPPMDVDELDVDIQPVPAGIPPIDVIEE